MSTKDINTKKVIIIIGPTAVGKTSISIELAKSINSENFMLTISFILFGSVFCGLISFIFLIVLSFITVPKN